MPFICLLDADAALQTFTLLIIDIADITTLIYFH
jgi:hypothetical protein